MTYLTKIVQDCFEVDLNQKDQSILQNWLSNWNLFVNELHQHFGLMDPIDEVANVLDNLHMKSSDKIFIYNVDFMCYAFQLCQRNSILYHHYYQNLPNQIQDPISTQKQGKPTSFQDMYALAITINHHYWEHSYEHHHVRQAEKEALESHFWKQDKASTAGNAMVSQSKTNTSPAALSTKSASKLSLSPTPKKQLNFLQVDLSSKLASNGKLTSDKHKKWLENNLCLYYSVGDYKLDFCPKKQTTVTFKGYSTVVTTDPLAATSKKSLEKKRTTPRNLHRLRAILNFPIQQ